MTDSKPNTPSSSASQEPADERKPFEAPRLTREADLVRRTAERGFTFSASAGS